MMCLKEFLFLTTALLLLQCPVCSQFQVVSTTQHPTTTQPDYQQKFLFALNGISEHLVNVEKQLATLEILINNVTQAKSKTLPKSCYDILKSGNAVSGVHVIRPNASPAAFAVRCNMDAMGGGWTYLLNRYDGSQNFYLKWEEYKKGFGDLQREFWLGLEYLHHLTGSQDNELLVEVVDWDNKKAYALYDQFRLGSESEGYSIKVLSGFSGDAGDSLTYHLGSKFSTNDRDNDGHEQNCAANLNGAWWYKGCYFSQLTATYFNYNADGLKGMVWRGYREFHSLKEARMMVRSRG